MTIVYADMVGDLFHYGHVEFLRKAKEFGDILYIGVNGDEVVSKYKRKPILNIEERKKEIEGCKYVDLVVINCPCPITKEFIEKYKIDYVLHGDDFNEEDIEKWYHVPKKLNMLKIVPYTKGISTTEIIERIINQNKNNS